MSMKKVTADENVYDSSKVLSGRIVEDVIKSISRKKYINYWLMREGEHNSNDIFRCLVDNGIIPSVLK